MKVAIPYWQGRVSPVFDVASHLLLVVIDHGQELNRQEIHLTMSDLQTRVRLLKELGTNTVICGAISRPLELAMVVAEIEVISQICGDIEEVLTAFITGRLDQELFVMPGCCGRHRRFRGGNR